MTTIQSMGCCGIREIEDIYYTPNTEELVKKVCEELYEDDNNCAFLVFTDIKKKQYGKNLKSFILKKKMGTVIQTLSKKNPNSGNSLKAWIWTINHKNLKKWWKQHRPNDYDESDNPWD